MTLKPHINALAAAPATRPNDAAFYADVTAGLSQTPKTLPCKYFYDERGSRLFEQICETPEYYPTRTEIGILRGAAREIAALMGAEAHLVELGSGPSTKVRILLDAAPELASYVPVDISGAYLLHTAAHVAADYPDLRVAPVCADFSKAFALPHLTGNGRVVGFFPGSTIGNFTPREAQDLLRRFAAALGYASGLLIGVDLKKDAAVLDAAYNDEAGVTAAFNLNVLHRMNRELGADFNVEKFSHRAIYNAGAGRIEMYLDSRAAQTVRIRNQQFRFAKGEPIGTEHSYKYTVEEFRALAARAGYACRAVWRDPQAHFSVFYLTLDN